jgi:cysteine desulfurase/selenocysteine lyase
LLIDASQAISHQKIDLQQTPCTYLAASAHKMYAPEGVGILVLPEEQLQNIEPLLLGGGSIHFVHEDSYELLTTEQRLEAGTANTSGIIGFGAAIDFVNEINFDTIISREAELGKYFFEALSKKSLLIRLINLPQTNSSAIFSFISKVHPHDISDELDNKGIAIRAGFHCAEPLHRALNIGATSRVSLAFYNSEEEIDYFFDVLSVCLQKYL